MSSGRRFPASGRGSFVALALSAGGLGYMRPFSGTWGSLPPPLLAVGLMAIDAPGWMVTASLALLCAFASIACVRFGAESERMFGSHDPSSVVADEVAGGALALLVVPWWMLAGSGHASLHAALITGSAGFIGFRIFDVWKPGFVFTLQDYKGGWGILLDDLGAAACTWPVALLASVLTIPVRSTVG